MSTTVVAPVAVAIGGVCMATASETSQRASKYNILTDTQVDFDAIHGSLEYDQSFLDNLRCNQQSFDRLCQYLRQEMKTYVLCISKKHSFEMKAAVFLYFLASRDGQNIISRFSLVDVGEYFIRRLERRE